MRINIEIDDELMSAVLKIGKFKHKKEAMEEGLRLLLELKKQEELCYTQLPRSSSITDTN